MLLGSEHGQAGGLAVDEDLIADWADFTCCEEAGEREVFLCAGDLACSDRETHFGGFFTCGHDVEGFHNLPGIVMGGIEHFDASTVAGEEECAGGSLVELLRIEEEGEVFGCGGLIAEVELDGLSDLEKFHDGDSAVCLVNPEDVADEEVVAPETGFVFVDGAAEKEAALQLFALLAAERVKEVFECIDGGTAAEAGDELTLDTGYDVRWSDGATALRDERINPHVARERDTDAAVAHDAVVEDEDVAFGPG